MDDTEARDQFAQVNLLSKPSQFSKSGKDVVIEIILA
jgi:hypothetical protein